MSSPFSRPRGAGGAGSGAGRPTAPLRPGRWLPPPGSAVTRLGPGRSSLDRGKSLFLPSAGARASVDAPARTTLRPAATHCPPASRHGPAALQPRPVRGRRRLPPRPRGRGFRQSQVTRGDGAGTTGLPSRAAGVPGHRPHTLIRPPPRLPWGLRIERPRLVVTLGVLHPSLPLPTGPQERMPTRSPGVGIVALYGTRTPIQGGGGSRDANSAPVGGVGGRGESPRAAAPGKAHAHWLRCQGCLAPIGCRAEKSVCHECALDGLPSGAAGLTCRGLSRARTGVPGWLAAAGSGCRSCARGKDTHGWKVPATLAFGPGYPLCIRDLGARHPPASGTVALVMDGKGSGCRAPPFFFFLSP